MEQVAIAGGTPVECLDPTAVVNRYFTGEGTLHFYPDPKFRTPDPENAPRRIQFIRDPEVVRVLVGPLYNKKGIPPLFRIADDILDQGRKGFFRQQVREAVGDEYVTMEEFKELVRDIQMLGAELTSLREQSKKGKAKE